MAGCVRPSGGRSDGEELRDPFVEVGQGARPGSGWSVAGLGDGRRRPAEQACGADVVALVHTVGWDEVSVGLVRGSEQQQRVADDAADGRRGRVAAGSCCSAGSANGRRALMVTADAMHSSDALNVPTSSRQLRISLPREATSGMSQVSHHSKKASRRDAAWVLLSAA